MPKINGLLANKRICKKIVCSLILLLVLVAPITFLPIRGVQEPAVSFSKNQEELTINIPPKNLYYPETTSQNNNVLQSNTSIQNDLKEFSMHIFWSFPVGVDVWGSPLA